MSRKLEEKQRRREAEERRKAAERRAARRRNLLTFGLIVLIGVAVVALVVSERNKQVNPSAAADIGVPAARAGCSDIQRPEDLGADHVAEGTHVEYSSRPPTSGPHYDTPASAGFYSSPLDPRQVVHNLEHGQIVIWYRLDAPQQVIDDIEAYVESDDTGIALLGVPYDDIPDEYTLAVTAWGALRYCAQVSPEVLDDFRAQFQGKGPENVGVPTFSG